VLIDWFTVAAQALNFVILLWLMKRFLYGPILGAIDAREKKIAAELADAAAQRAEAEHERDTFQHKNEEFEAQRAALLHDATDEANSERRRLLGEARAAADLLLAQRQEMLRSDARDSNRALAKKAGEEVFAIVRKALKDLSTTSLEERMSEVFTCRLQALDGPTKARLGEALKTTSDPARVHSAFNLPTPQRRAIQDALNVAFSAEVPVQFETASDLIGGIELTTNGQKLAWSIDDYLVSLEKSVGELLSERAQPESEIEPPGVNSRGGSNERSA
jgi:F-type H+-transporting ATPase subunit b